MDKTICKNLTNVPSATFNIITNDTLKVLFPGGRGGGYLGKFPQIPYPIIVYFVTKIHFSANM